MATALVTDGLQRRLAELLVLSRDDDRWPPSTLLQDLVVSGLFLVSAFHALGAPQLPPKRAAWALSAVSSMTTATLSMAHVHRLFLHGGRWDGVGPDCAALIFQDDRLSRFAVAFFMAFLILDIAIGLRYYRSQIHPLSGWVHHIFYLGLLGWALSSHFCAGFCLFLPAEIPTFILALGSLYPERRSDLLFGLTFFVTRVCYHGLLFRRILAMEDPPIPIWIPTFLTFLLHLYWMYLWCRSYARKQLRVAGGKGDGEWAGSGAPSMAATSVAAAVPAAGPATDKQS